MWLNRCSTRIIAHINVNFTHKINKFIAHIVSYWFWLNQPTDIQLPHTFNDSMFKSVFQKLTDLVLHFFLYFLYWNSSVCNHLLNHSELFKTFTKILLVKTGNWIMTCICSYFDFMSRDNKCLGLTSLVDLNRNISVFINFYSLFGAGTSDIFLFKK